MRLLLLCVAFRSLSLLLPQTFFQPDEFYQALEPAYEAAFGRGFLTWEWHDLPRGVSAAVSRSSHQHSAWYKQWDDIVVGGRLRGWLWPGVFLVLYKVLAFFCLDRTRLIIIAPRAVGVLVAAATDYHTSKLACKVLGPGYASGALLLSFTSLFHGHLLTRALSTSPETLLTVMALVYYPLPGLSVKPQLPVPDHQQQGKNYGVMDRREGIADGWDCPSISANSIKSQWSYPLVAAALAATSICIRPTMLVFWGYVYLECSLRLWRSAGLLASAEVTAKVLLGGMTAVALSTLLDWLMVGRLVFPVLTFFHRNIVMNISTFYGATNITYHLVQSLPIMLFPIWYWWAKGFAAALLPASISSSLASLDTPPPLCTLARAVTFAVAALSLSPHSEWRFLHPMLPVLLLFALPALQQTYTASVAGGHYFWTSLRQYCRVPRGAWLLVTLAPIIPYIYLNTFHGAAQVSVIHNLHSGQYGDVRSVVALMPCHSTPWASHLGHIDGWFITCQPPLDSTAGRTEQDMFYDSPVSYVQQVFPHPPSAMPPPPLSRKQAVIVDGSPVLPSHIILFGELLNRTENMGEVTVSVAQALEERGYDEIAELWNGFDLAQDEEKRKGAVRVWSLKRVPLKDELGQ